MIHRKIKIKNRNKNNTYITSHFLGLGVPSILGLGILGTLRGVRVRVRSDIMEKLKIKIKNNIYYITSHFLGLGIERGADIQVDIELACPLKIVSKIICIFFYKLVGVFIEP